MSYTFWQTEALLHTGMRLPLTLSTPVVLSGFGSVSHVHMIPGIMFTVKHHHLTSVQSV